MGKEKDDPCLGLFINLLHYKPSTPLRVPCGTMRTQLPELASLKMIHFSTISWENCLILMLPMGPFLLLAKPLPIPVLLSALHFRRTGQRGTLIIATSPNEQGRTLSAAGN